ncbi:MAG: F0F1 ATP synthase subunit delta [Candidatus Moranbacteria bacterium]|nr:F0F1 ATP synthase subunit delta [Candidatus Moranbacteria bacterium]
MFQLRHYIEAVAELLAEKSGQEKDKVVKGWLRVLRSHHRDLEANKISEIIDEEISKGREKAEVVVAGEQEKEALEKTFSQSNIAAEWKINPEEIGGARIIYKNTLIDNTVKNRLERLGNRLQENG